MSREPTPAAAAPAVPRPGRQPRHVLRRCDLRRGSREGALLGPVQCAFGWHVILFKDRRPDARAASTTPRAGGCRRGLRAPLPGTCPTGPTPADGGDLGWVAKDQLDDRPDAAIFATPSARRRRMTIADDGHYLFKVLGEETADARRPTSSTIFKDSGIHRLVHGQEGRGRRSRSPSPAGRRLADRPVLDALVAEARLRWGLDPAPASRSSPPSGCSRRRSSRRGRSCSSRSPSWRSSADASARPTRPLPGRHGPRRR